MNTITPFFEVDGKRYEIMRTRYLLAEYDKMRENSNLSNEDKENAIKVQTLTADIHRYALKTQELWEAYEQTFNDEDERKYLKVKALYENAMSQLTKLEVESGCTARVKKAGINILEKLAILGLAEQHFEGNYEKAETIWIKFVESLGKDNVPEWLSAMSECLFTDEGDGTENPFLAQMRAKREKAIKS